MYLCHVPQTCCCYYSYERSLKKVLSNLAMTGFQLNSTGVAVISDSFLPGQPHHRKQRQTGTENTKWPQPPPTPPPSPTTTTTTVDIFDYSYQLELVSILNLWQDEL